MSFSPLSPETKLCKIDELVEAVVGDTYVVMSVEDGRYYTLDPTGSFIWNALDTPVTLNDLVEKLLAEFAVTPDRCETETSAFAKSLMDLGLVRVVD